MEDDTVKEGSMKIKCKVCGRLQEVSEKDWNITQEGMPSGLPAPLDMLPAHPYTCCGENMAPVCAHSRVFPIRGKYLHFFCLGCKKELEVRDADSLRILRPAFMQAAYLLSRGVQVGPN